jgi:hypothetical protein
MRTRTHIGVNFSIIVIRHDCKGVMQGNIWSGLQQPEPPIPMLFPSHFSLSLLPSVDRAIQLII